MKRYPIYMFALGLMLVFFVTLLGAAEMPKRGGTLRMAIRKDMRLMNPLVGTQSTERRIRSLMFEPLLGIDLQGKIQPNLAESWKVSKDGKTYTFYLRKGVKFHNGKEMTAEDVKFAIDYTRNPKNGAYGFTNLAVISRAEAADKYTLKLRLKTGSPAFLTSLTSIRSFSVIPKESLEEGINKPAKLPPGTGPFRFVDWKPRQRIVLARFDDYWGHKALIDRLELRIIRDATVQFTALRAGDVDFVERTPYPWVRQIVKGKVKGVRFAKSRYAGFRRLRFNVTAPPFDNRKLRLAVAHAIDKKQILQAAYYGFGEMVDQKYPKNHTRYFKGINFPSYDLDKAKALLREAGYKGETIEIVLRHGEDAETEATTLKAQLAKIGMNIDLNVMDSGTYTARRHRGKFAFSFDGSSSDPDPWPTYARDLMCPQNLKNRSGNVSGYCNKEVDALFKKAQGELNKDKRNWYFREILTKVAEDVPSVYVAFVPRFFTFRDYVKGFTTDAGGASYRWWGGGMNYTWLDK